MILKVVFCNFYFSWSKRFWGFFCFVIGVVLVFKCEEGGIICRFEDRNRRN